MKTIPLSQGRLARVDDEDYPRLAGFKWSYKKDRSSPIGYAVRHPRKTRSGTLLYLHREVMNAPPGYAVIFLNRDRLDCRKENLKVLPTAEARRSHPVRPDCKSGVKGVRYNEKTRRWNIFLYREGRRISLGSCPTKEEARQAYELTVPWLDRKVMSRPGRCPADWA